LASKRKSRMQWCRVDLHIHTPASADYIDPETRYIDILRQAEKRGLEIIAFTDHNTVNGYATMMQEVEQLAYLEQLGRAQPDELQLLADYRRLLDKILVLPGFEFTATFGFHVLGIFSPEMSLRQIEHLLLSLNIPANVLDEGTSHVGASADVLTAYHTINEAGGICIAAHANTTHGVAMRGMDFGGQTRIAYTQDHNLHALEVTDLGRKGPRNTQRFFDGTKPEYPRRMRCIQGSDSHSLNTIRDKGRVVTLGVGERATEVLLRERSFEGLLEMFQSNDFSRSRPYTPDHQPEDYIQTAREEGPTVVQSFYESIERRGGKLYNILADVCAFANTNGGTVYIGLSPDKKRQPSGVSDPQNAINTLQSEINSLITPSLPLEIDTQETGGKTIIRIQVPFGQERPYAIDNTKIYVRDEADTSIAIRDEIVNLVQQGMNFQQIAETTPVTPSPLAAAPPLETSTTSPVISPPAAESESDRITPPRAGVEIVGSEQRGDVQYYIMRDLRNGNIVKNVTRSSARRLWHYAIKQKESNPVREDQVEWQGEIGLWRRYRKSGNIRYDLVQRDNGMIRVYYGATESGMHGPWQQFLAPEDRG
jgi:hypothetical protein